MKAVFVLAVLLAGLGFALTDAQRSGSSKSKSSLRGQHLAVGELSLASERLGKEHHAIQHSATSINATAVNTYDAWRQVCGVTNQATQTSERGKTCPSKCPLYVHDKTDVLHCSFMCVPVSVSACQELQPHTPVPDEELGICRSCKVSGCHTCLYDGTDTCAKCKAEHNLVDGKCVRHHSLVWYAVLGFLGVIALLLTIWLVSLSRRAITNQDGVDRGLRTRSAAKLHMPQDDSDVHSSRALWPMDTNLLTQPIAGLGVMHQFNFQFMLIVWASGVLIAWIAMGYFVDSDFFVVGTQPVGATPRDNCIIIAWGFTTQQKLMFAKTVFVSVLYGVSFLLALLYAVRQMSHHSRAEKMTITHKGFCAKCVGLPQISGKERKLEDELASAVTDTTGQKVLGTSICWDFAAKVDVLMRVIEADVEARIKEDAESGGGTDGNLWSARQSQDSSPEGPDEQSTVGWVHRMCVHWEYILLSPHVQRIIKKQHGSSALAQSSIRRHGNNKGKQEADGCASRGSARSDKEADGLTPRGTMNQRMTGETIVVDIEEELESLYTTDIAFIVFNTQSSRDAAVEAASHGTDGIDFHGSKLYLEFAPCEPQAVNWNRVTNQTPMQTLVKTVCGMMAVILALVLWVCCFYYPYANLVLKTDYANGTDPNATARTLFGFIVIAGNAMMYVICAEVSDRIGFRLQRSREICYMLLYCFACVFNVVLDLTMAYHMALGEQVGREMKTHDGRPLVHGMPFTDSFDTYAMQKSLGKILLDYSFPATFLIPFLVEPFVVIIVPYQIMSMIVRTHPSIKKGAADAYLASTPMDLSRYADILLNVMLACLCFFFPGGYVVYMFGGLVVSHIVIYNYDRLRVLYSIPTCDFASQQIDQCAQWLLSVPCGILLSCAVFKANCDDDNILGSCWQDAHLGGQCFLVFVCHVALHSILLFYVVPVFATVEQHSMPALVRSVTGLRGASRCEMHSEKYKKCSQLDPCSWWSANMVHCLRTKYFKNGQICDPYIVGYQYLIRKNEEHHCHFSTAPPELEVFNTMENVKTLASSAQKTVAKKSHDFKDFVEEKGHNLKDRLSRSDNGSSPPSKSDASEVSGKPRLDSLSESLPSVFDAVAADSATGSASPAATVPRIPLVAASKRKGKGDKTKVSLPP